MVYPTNFYRLFLDAYEKIALKTFFCVMQQENASAVRTEAVPMNNFANLLAGVCTV